ncbi:MAG: PA domain-containing protein, partial [Thermoanaerobaculia bacterium]
IGTGTDACEPLVGFTAGNIALIDQGFCEFCTKVLNAEIAGALAAVVVSTTGDVLITMEPGTDGGAVTIPSAFLGQTDGDLIKAELGQTVTVNLHANLPFAEERR